MKTYALAAVLGLVTLGSYGCSASDTGSSVGSDAPEVVACDDVQAAKHAPGSPAERLDQLLTASAEGRDFPIATLHRLEIDRCMTAASLELETSAARRALANAVIAALEWGDMRDAVSVGATVSGAAKFDRILDKIVAHLEELEADGLFSPQGSGQSALWADRAKIVADLEGEVAGHEDRSVLEIPFETELEECSEQAVARIDLRDGSVVVLRRTPRC